MMAKTTKASNLNHYLSFNRRGLGSHRNKNRSQSGGSVNQGSVTRLKSSHRGSSSQSRERTGSTFHPGDTIKSHYSRRSVNTSGFSGMIKTLKRSALKSGVVREKSR
mmetsp:Transcript_20643/g.31479  ORF Transcript_20643/g.31479 Transcript_20643/m.31479 type:complete len:107 (+) Transcript_20643:642-962(+)